MVANAFAGFGSLKSDGSDPDIIAKVIYEAVTEKSDKIRLPAGDDGHRMVNERTGVSDEEHQKKMKQQFNLAELNEISF